MHHSIPLFASAAITFLGACALDGSDGTSPEDRGPVNCVSTVNGTPTCYATFTEAIAVATRGEITDAPADSRDIPDRAAFAARIEAYDARVTATAATTNPTPNPTGTIDSPVVIGIVYKDSYYQGNSWVFQEPTGCDGNYATVDYYVANLNASPYSDYGFNDSISSFQSFSSCRTTLYTDWYGGGSDCTAFNTPTVCWNDTTSSIYWE